MIRAFWTVIAAAAFCWAAPLSPAAAQSPPAVPVVPDPGEVDSAPELETPATPTDPEIDALIQRLVGSYEGEEHTLRIAEVQSPPFQRPLYVELVREGFETTPDRQQLWWIHRRDGELRVRVNIFPQRQRFLFATSLPDLAVGMWAAPEFYPRLAADTYDALGDLTVASSGDRTTLASERRFPIQFGGALHTDVNIAVASDSITWTEIGYDEKGEVVWGDTPISMQRLSETPKAEVREGGVRIITLREGRGEEVVEGVKIALHFDGWLTNGMLIDSTRIEGKQLLVGSYPVNSMPGFNVGLRGMLAPESPKEAPLFSGGIRRVLIPPHMALGDRGAPPIIPPGSPMIFNFELQSVLPEPIGNTDQPPQPPLAPPEGGPGRD